MLYNISKTTTPFVNAAVNEGLRQLVPFFHNGLFQVIDSSKFSVMVDNCAEERPKQHNPRGLDPGCLGATSEAQHAGCKSTAFVKS